jgi:hypothetical protein
MNTVIAMTNAVFSLSSKVSEISILHLLTWGTQQYRTYYILCSHLLLLYIEKMRVFVFIDETISGKQFSAHSLEKPGLGVT